MTQQDPDTLKEALYESFFQLDRDMLDKHPKYVFAQREAQNKTEEIYAFAQRSLNLTPSPSSLFPQSQELERSVRCYSTGLSGLALAYHHRQCRWVGPVSLIFLFSAAPTHPCTLNSRPCQVIRGPLLVPMVGWRTLRRITSPPMLRKSSALKLRAARSSLAVCVATWLSLGPWAISSTSAIQVHLLFVHVTI